MTLSEKKRMVDNERKRITSEELLGFMLLFYSVTCLGFTYVTSRYARLYSDFLPLTFVACCLIVNFLFVIVFQLYKIFLFPGDNCDEVLETEIPNMTWSKVIYWGAIVGLLFVALSVATQYALVTETAGQVSFICGVYIVLIPFFEIITSNFESFPPLRTWLSIAIASVGLFFVSGCAEVNCFDNGFESGIWWSLLAMITIAGQIVMSAFATQAIGSTLTVMSSFTIATIASVILALIFEPDFYTLTSEKLMTNLWLIVAQASFDFLSVLFMTMALNYLDISRAAILLSTESLFGAIFGYFILDEGFTARELFGGVLMLCAVFLEVFPSQYCCCAITNIDADDTDDVKDMSDIECNNETSPLMPNDTQNTRMRSRSRDTVDSTVSRASKASRVSTTSKCISRSTSFAHY